MKNCEISDPSAVKDTGKRDGECWNLVRRIAASPYFEKATQPREILLYLARRCVTEKAKLITEAEIARCVLQRRDDFDSSADSIVRVQISHVRKRLQAYFNAEGKDEFLLLTIPKGSYVLLFTSRPENTPGTPAASLFVSGWKLVVTGFAAGILFGLLCFVFFRTGVPGNPTTTLIPSPYRHNYIINKIFGGSTSPTVVLADSSLALVMDALDADANVHDYSDGSYIPKLINRFEDPKFRNTLHELYKRQFSSLGTIMVALHCQEVSQQFPNKAIVRNARDMHVRDFQNGNFILIGSRRSIPWVELFEPQLNFAFVGKPAENFYSFHNRRPAPGELNDYIPHADKDSYVDIAFVPNLGHNGYVLLLVGISSQAAEAASEYLLNAETPSNLLNLENSGKAFEVLLHNYISENTSSRFEVVATRILQ